MKIGDTVTVNRTYVDSVLGVQPSTPLLRQVLTSLERLANTESTVLELGWSAHQNNGTVLHWVRVVPKNPQHILYRPPQDGPGRGVTIHFTSIADRTNSFNCA